MSINHAVLGILSHKSLTGYDIKKIIQNSPFMYWSGNNNQIYKVLFELNNEGFVTNKTQHQDGLPTKKIYTITDDGLVELRRWSLSTPNMPEFKRPFLVQLAWSWQLSNDEIQNLLSQYEKEIEGQLLIEQGNAKARYFVPDSTLREEAVWNLIYKNIEDSYEQELRWIDEVRDAIVQFDDNGFIDDEKVLQNSIIEEEIIMNYSIAKSCNEKYILLEGIGKQLQTEQDALDLLSICAENETNLLMVQDERISDDFFRLRTGIAGAILQKFTTYNIKLAIVIDENRVKGKFKDFMLESNRGKMFNIYSNKEDAENWLIKK